MSTAGTHFETRSFGVLATAVNTVNCLAQLQVGGFEVEDHLLPRSRAGKTGDGERGVGVPAL